MHVTLSPIPTCVSNSHCNDFFQSALAFFRVGRAFLVLLVHLDSYHHYCIKMIATSAVVLCAYLKTALWRGEVCHQLDHVNWPVETPNKPDLVSLISHVSIMEGLPDVEIFGRKGNGDTYDYKCNYYLY